MTNAIVAPPDRALRTAESNRLDWNPAAVYLAGLKSERSRRVMADALNHVAAVLRVEPIMVADTTSPRRQQQKVTYLYVEWSALRFQHTSAIQNRLLEHYRPASVNRMMSAVNGVLKACWRLSLMSIEDYQRAIDYSPAKGSTLAAGRDISQGELLALAEVCKSDKSQAGLRDAAIIGLLYTCGLRRSELVALERKDFNLDTNQLKVLHGKGKKQRAVYVKNGALRALTAWLELRGAEPGPLFMPVSKAGKIEPRALTDQAVYNLLLKRGEQAQLEHFSPHDFRRTFVGDLLDRGTDIVTVQKMAGHASPNTTARYDRRPEKVKEDAASKLHFPF